MLIKARAGMFVSFRNLHFLGTLGCITMCYGVCWALSHRLSYRLHTANPKHAEMLSPLILGVAAIASSH